MFHGLASFVWLGGLNVGGFDLFAAMVAIQGGIFPVNVSGFWMPAASGVMRQGRANNAAPLGFDASGAKTGAVAGDKIQGIPTRPCINIAGDSFGGYSNPKMIITVLGCGGDRDPLKRPLMGKVAAQLSDIVIVTDDNPRSEDPAVIRQAVLAGASDGSAQVFEVSDRRAAISQALKLAQTGCVVAVLGKGHESGQEIAGQVLPFDDRVVVAEESKNV